MRINPVLQSGIKMRMRGVRAPILMSVYFLILLIIFALVFSAIDSDYSYPYMTGRPRPLGMDLLIPMYSLLVGMVFSMVVLMVPALNAGNISSEREKQTLDLLLLSRMSAIRIVLGKVFANLAFAVLLLVLTLPIFAVIYLFGNIMVWDIVKLFLFLVVCAYACGSLATFFSALVKKTSIATILTYVTMMLFVLLSVVLGLYLMSTYRRIFYYYDFFPLVLRINPIFTLIELLAAAESNAGAGTNTWSYFLEDVPISFFFYSTSFLLFVSPLLNIASAILIKPVKKFQIQRG